MRPFPSSSLIVATYNWPQALELCLLSIQQQKVLPGEVIIADDGSGEETARLIKSFRSSMPCPLRHVWQRDEGFRLGMIRNRAMASARGNYLIQIDGDLVLHPAFTEDHLSAAKPGHFIAGSRVMIGKDLSEKVLKNKQLNFSLFAGGLGNKANGLHLPGLARLLHMIKQEKGLYNLRGCNMSFWKKDILTVNGYNEDIVGWGREDTELVIRLYNKGIHRSWFKLQGIVYHIYHKEFDRSTLLRNDAIVKQALENKSSWCDKGINQYLHAQDNQLI